MQARYRQWIPVLGLIALMLVFQLIGPQLLRYETVLIQHHQWWRLITGHWVHANWVHYVLNMTGLLLCVALTEPGWTFVQWLWRILLLSIGISLLFWLFNSHIGWYVGFSGVLFGLYVLSAIATLKQQRFMSSLLLAVIGLKLILDLCSSVKIDSSELIGVPVLSDAHLYGVITALIMVLIHFSITLLIQTK